MTTTQDPIAHAARERLAPPREQDDRSADPAALAALAAATGGDTFALAALPEALASVLPGDELLASSAQPRWQTAWDRGWLLLLVVALLAAEWTLRRRSGLL